MTICYRWKGEYNYLKMIETLKNRLKQAILSKNEIEKSVLRVLLSEIDRRTNTKVISQDEIYNIIRKLIVSNKECNKIRHNIQLDLENQFLASLLPQELSKEEIFKHIQTLDFSQCKGSGAAVGLAMKYFKTKNLFVSGDTVKLCVYALLTIQVVESHHIGQ